MTDWKFLALPSAKQLSTRLLLSPAPEMLKGANNIDDALELLRASLNIKAGGGRTVQTPIDIVSIEDYLLRHIVEKRDAARERYAKWIIPTLENPTEIWLSRYENDELRQRYIKLFSDSDGKQTLVIVSIARGDALWNFIPMPTRSLDNQREGELLWKSYVLDES